MKAKQMFRKLGKNVQAVSPVIATLMLVLVAVAAAGAFFAWQTTWQDDRTDELGATGRSVLTIAGSSTVYPFTVAAAEMYEAEHPEVKISVTKGGSGAGEEGIRTGRLHIGCASHTVPDLEIDLNGDGEEDLVGQELVTQVATDAVVMVSAHTGFGSIDLNDSVVEDIYLLQSGEITVGDLQNPGLDGDSDGDITWSEFGSFYTGSSITGGSIKISDREETAGTEEVFTGKTTDLEGMGYGEQLTFACDISAYSNQNLVDEIASDDSIFGFMSLGIALSADVEVPATYNGVEPTKANAASGDLDGSRPLNMITLDMDMDGKLDAGLAGDFVSYCLIPDVNKAACGVADYVSIY